MEIGWFIFGYLTAIFLVLVWCIFFDRPDGHLRIDHSDPEKDKYLFEIDDLDKLSKKKHITLKVDNKADLSQK